MTVLKKKIMNIILSAAILLVPLSSLGASTYDEAQVLSAEPVYETVRREFPVQACREEQVAYRTGRDGFTTGPILGAIIGGALGNAVGHEKRNKQVGAVVGAVLGGSIGADISRRHRQGQRGAAVGLEPEPRPPWRVRRGGRVGVVRLLLGAMER